LLVAPEQEAYGKAVLQEEPGINRRRWWKL